MAGNADNKVNIKKQLEELKAKRAELQKKRASHAAGAVADDAVQTADTSKNSGEGSGLPTATCGSRQQTRPDQLKMKKRAPATDDFEEGEVAERMDRHEPKSPSDRRPVSKEEKERLARNAQRRKDWIEGKEPYRRESSDTSNNKRSRTSAFGRGSEKENEEHQEKRHKHYVPGNRSQSGPRQYSPRGKSHHVARYHSTRLPMKPSRRPAVGNLPRMRPAAQNDKSFEPTASDRCSQYRSSRQHPNEARGLNDTRANPRKRLREEEEDNNEQRTKRSRTIQDADVKERLNTTNEVEPKGFSVADGSTNAARGNCNEAAKTNNDVVEPKKEKTAANPDTFTRQAPSDDDGIYDPDSNAEEEEGEVQETKKRKHSANEASISQEPVDETGSSPLPTTPQKPRKKISLADYIARKKSKTDNI